MKQRFHLNQTTAQQLESLAANHQTDPATYLAGLIGFAFVRGGPCGFQGQEIAAPAPTVASAPSVQPVVNKAAFSAATSQFAKPK